MAAKKELIDLDPIQPPIDYDRIEQDLRDIYDAPEHPLAIDTETTGLFVHDGRDRAIGISYATVIDGEPKSGYLGFGHVVGEPAPKNLVDMLGYVIESQPRPLIFQGAQFDLNALLSVDIDARDQLFYDLPTMGNLIDENMPQKTMVALAKRYAPYVEKLTEDAWLNDQKTRGWPDVTPERMYAYGTNDAEVSYCTWLEMSKHSEWTRLPAEVWDYKHRAIRVLLSMRRRGVLLDKEVTQLMADRGNAIMSGILKELGYPALGPKALNDLLIEKLWLPVVKRSPKTNAPSFDKEAMEEYDAMLEEMDSPLAKTIFTYRGWQKATSAGYQAYLDKVSPDGRVRTEYTTHVARTGRLSSKGPNLQQIPKESDKVWNGQMKACFVSTPGFKMWNVDYSQLELRLMAAFAGVPELKQVFIEGRDIFTEMAEALGYTRNTIKTFVYANSYGAGDKKIAKNLGITLAEAKKIRSDYYSKYPALRLISSKLTKEAERNKKIVLWSGRARHMPYYGDAYKALNSFIQGGGADIVERAMVRVYEEVCDENCFMLMQVHDAFVFEIREGMEDHYLPRIREIMCDVDTLIADRIPNGLGTTIAVDGDPWPTFVDYLEGGDD